MKILGITGGSNTGKSSIVNAIHANPPCKLVYFDADQALHRLYAEDTEVIEAIAQLCPDAVKDGKVDRRALGNFYFASDENAKAVENVTIEKIREAFHTLVAEHREENNTLLIADMPLLTEIGLHKYCDHVLVTVCDYEERTQRGTERIAKSKSIPLQDAREIFDNIQRRQSGLPLEKRQHMPPETCAYIGDRNRLGKLGQYSHTIIDTSNQLNGRKRTHEETVAEATQEALAAIYKMLSARQEGLSKA